MAKVRINDAELRRVLKRFRAGNARVRVGVLSGQKHPDSDLSMAELAALHEYGTKDIPERSFIRAPLESSRADVKRMMHKAAVAVVSGKVTPRASLEILGQWGVTTIRKWVTVGSRLAPNAPSTIKRKGSARPLVDTGRLLGAVSYEVID